MNKDLKKLAKLAAKTPGWEFGATRSGHYRFVPPTGQIVVVASSGSDHRGWKNEVARLRAAGLDVPRG